MKVADEPSTVTHDAARRVLVINDSPSFLSLMREILEVEGGYEVVTIDQSEDAAIGPDGSPPDLIILDIAFRTGPTGLQVAERLAGDNGTSGIPILFCTALREQDIDERARALITTRHQRILYKPFNVDDILRHVEELLAARDAVARSI